MNLNVYEDGEKVGEVEVDITDIESIKSVLETVFDCDELEDEDVEVEIGEEVYIALSEIEYLWSK